MAVVFGQAAPFSGPAYQHLRARDVLPSYCEIGDEADPLCRVKLFHPGSRWTYYVCAATDYDGKDGSVDLPRATAPDARQPPDYLVGREREQLGVCPHPAASSVTGT